ncbi:DUF2188 domain-containing protein [uncultured Arenimonas sp.]|uniref:DUF2188 domain-containing protein n=1 Tax=uncultured Arenimonas sp. TaxID=546226 RepID=UPI0030D94C22
MKRTRTWKASWKGVAAVRYPTQGAAITAISAALRACEKAGILGELIIKGKDGQIRDNRTYGQDPGDIPG